MNLDIVITGDEHSVDMKSGLNTLLGVSDTVTLITDTVLTESVSKRITSAKKVRTRLKQSFKGSYGQIFSIEIKDDVLKKRFKEIGNSAIAELIRYFISEALHIEPLKLSDKASGILTKLTGIEEELTDLLRKSSLRNAHDAPISLGRNVKIRHRENKVNFTEIIELSKETSIYLNPTVDKSIIKISASITRLNINTGNGRLALENATETVAFGFVGKYREQKNEAKKKFSENLNVNNLVKSENWKRIDMLVKPMRSRNGNIIKYLITSVS